MNLTEKQIEFLWEAVQRVKKIFGPNVRCQLEDFQFSDDDWSDQHFVIDSPHPPEVSCDLLDTLCDSWWDEEALKLESKIYPVLGSV